MEFEANKNRRKLSKCLRGQRWSSAQMAKEGTSTYKAGRTTWGCDAQHSPCLSDEWCLWIANGCCCWDATIRTRAKQRSQSTLGRWLNKAQWASNLTPIWCGFSNFTPKIVFFLIFSKFLIWLWYQQILIYFWPFGVSFLSRWAEFLLLCQDFTKVTFYPDLKRFGMTKLDKETQGVARSCKVQFQGFHVIVETCWYMIVLIVHVGTLSIACRLMIGSWFTKYTTGAKYWHAINWAPFAGYALSSVELLSVEKCAVAAGRTLSHSWRSAWWTVRAELWFVCYKFDCPPQLLILHLPMQTITDREWQWQLYRSLHSFALGQLPLAASAAVYQLCK